MLEPGILISLATVGVGAVVWSVRMEGRVNGHDKLFEEKEKLNMERDKNLLERHAEIAARLGRIENKIDHGFGNGTSKVT